MAPLRRESTGENAIEDKRTSDDEQARARAEEAKREAERVMVRLLAKPEALTGLRGPEWAWYAAGFAALAIGLVALHYMRPPPFGMEPELLAPMGALPSQKTGKPQTAVARLEVSASIPRGALELRVPRLPSDLFGAVVAIDSSNQRWLIQRGDWQDPTCLPKCEGDMATRVELNRLARGAFRVVVLVAPKAIPPIPTMQWLQDPDEPAASLGARAYGSARVERE